MVTTEERSVQEIVRMRRHCDVCGEPMTMQCTSHECKICGCDLCSACSHDVEEYWHYCPKCWEVGVVFRTMLKTAMELYDQTECGIIRAWEKAAGVKERENNDEMQR
jgi:hypothetical protein